MLKHGASIPYSEDGGSINPRKVSYTPTKVNNFHVWQEPNSLRLSLSIMKIFTIHFFLDITVWRHKKKQVVNSFWKEIDFVCMYIVYVCTFYVYVHCICMYIVYVCTLYIYVHLCVCTLYMYIYCICMYIYVYVHCICIYIVYVCTFFEFNTKSDKEMLHLKNSDIRSRCW